MKFEFFNPVKVVMGKDSLNELGLHTKRYGNKALLVTTGTRLKDSGLVERVKRILEKENIETEYFHEVGNNPLTTQIDKGAEIAKKQNVILLLVLVEAVRWMQLKE